MSELVARLEQADDPAEMVDPTIDDIGYYAARLYYETAIEDPDIETILRELPDATSLISFGVRLDDAIEERNPSRMEQIYDLALSGAAASWAQNYALAAIEEGAHD